MADHTSPDVSLIEQLLAHPEIAGHFAGLKRLRVAVNPEAGAVSGHGRVGGLQLVVTGPVDAETAEEAFHITRVIPRSGHRLRLDFSYPPADLAGTAETDEAGQVVDLDITTG